MNHKTQKIILFTGITFGLIACGEKVTIVNENQVGVQSYEAVEKFPKCTKDNIGEMAVSVEDGLVYYCNNNEWKLLNGKDGEDGLNGKDGKDGEPGLDGEDGSAGVAGDKGKSGSNGVDGRDGKDGESCTAENKSNGVEVSCAGKVIGTLTNGAKGSDGTTCSAESTANGVKVSCGGAVVGSITNGQNGTDGKSCTAKTVTNGIEISCGGTVIGTLTNGAKGDPGKSCTAKNTQNGIQVSCGGTVVGTLTNGKDGVDGTSCTAVRITDGIKVSCGGTVVGTLSNGINGKDGKSCSAIPVENGIQVSCGEEIMGVLPNAENGTNGKSCSAIQVENGVQVSCGGEIMGVLPNGTDGMNGKKCTAKTVTNGIEFSCDGDVVETIQNGRNGDYGRTKCHVQGGLDANNIGYYTLICGENSITIFNGIWDLTGEKGDDGEDCFLTDLDTAIKITCGNNSTILRKAVCGSKAFNPEYRGCLDGIIRPLCGRNPYNPATALCKYDSIYSCNNKPYDPDTVLCHLNNEYKAVSVGFYTWLNKNINANGESIPSSCYANITSNCGMYGSLFTWENVRRACPTGWHLPTVNEWNNIAQTMEGLQLKTTYGWDLNGYDTYNFSALPGGYWSKDDNKFKDKGSYAYFWSSNQYDSSEAYGFALHANILTNTGRTNKGSKMSVRCVKD